MNLFLVPGNPDNERATLSRTVTFGVAEKFLEPSDVSRLKIALEGRRPFHCWAMKEGSSAAFRRMEPNDEVLFFISGTSQCKYRARVICKAKSGKFGESIWPHDSLDWKLIYFLGDLTPVEVNKRLLLSAFGYDNPRDDLAGIRRVKDNCVREILREYGSVSRFLDAVKVASPLVRLQCAELSSLRRSSTSSQKPGGKANVDERAALLYVVENAGYSRPPVADVPKLIEKVSERVKASNFPLNECAAQVLGEYMENRKV